MFLSSKPINTVNMTVNLVTIVLRGSLKFSKLVAFAWKICWFFFFFLKSSYLRYQKLTQGNSPTLDWSPSLALGGLLYCLLSSLCLPVSKPSPPLLVALRSVSFLVARPWLLTTSYGTQLIWLLGTARRPRASQRALRDHPQSQTCFPNSASETLQIPSGGVSRASQGGSWCEMDPKERQ